jgi:hypothetical protein
MQDSRKRENGTEKMTGASTLSRRDRLRRVVILCRNFAVNLAYYRAGRRVEYLHLQDYQKRGNFWRAISGNFIDICVLEWCKLFADSKGKHHWSKVVSDPADFKTQLFKHLGIDEAAFQKEIEMIRRYRDKFLAHLDSDEIMNIPALDIAKKAVWFYHSYVVQHEAQPGDLAGLPLELDAGYAQCENEARAIYDRNT